MKILHLTLHRKWFDAIASGVKREEYRAITDYWTTRLQGRQYGEIHFRNGYACNAPFMRVEFLGLRMGNWRGETVYAIQLDRILELRDEKHALGNAGHGENSHTQTQPSIFDAQANGELEALHQA